MSRVDSVDSWGGVDLRGEGRSIFDFVQDLDFQLNWKRVNATGSQLA